MNAHTTRVKGVRSVSLDGGRPDGLLLIWANLCRLYREWRVIRRETFVSREWVQALKRR